MSKEYLYHYTNLDSLACILESKRIRFSRLDLVDDLIEVNTPNFPIDLRKFIFTSCWTETKSENIALWSMYTQKLTGVIIALPKNSIDFSKVKEDYLNTDGRFKYSIFKPDKELVNIEYKDTEKTKIYIDIDDSIVKNCCDNEEKNKCIWKLITNNQLDFNKLGIVKSRFWDFQKEWRYRIFICPKLEIIKDEFGTFPNHEEIIASDNLKNIDIPIKTNMLNKMKIVLGPNQNDGHKYIVESLLRNYKVKALIEYSTLKDIVRI